MSRFNCATKQIFVSMSYIKVDLSWPYLILFHPTFDIVKIDVMYGSLINNKFQTFIFIFCFKQG